MKTGDVEKIVDIQWAKTLKNEKAKIALIFTKNSPLYHHTSQIKIFIDTSLISSLVAQ